MIRGIDSLLRYHYKITQEEIDTWPDERWAREFNDLEWVRKKEADSNTAS